jgi:hypothetical protein
MEPVHEFTGGNPEMEESLSTTYRQETEISGMQTGLMRETYSYISKATGAPKKPEQFASRMTSRLTG